MVVLHILERGFILLITPFQLQRNKTGGKSPSKLNVRFDVNATFAVMMTFIPTPFDDA